MKFDTEAKRLAHPQAVCIPENVMKMYFGNELADELISLMQIKTEEALLQKIDALRQQYRGKEAMLWLAIAFSHPDFTPEQLVKLAQRMGCDDNRQIELAIILNRKNYWDYLSTQQAYPKSIASYPNFIRQLGSLAIKFANFDVIRYLEKEYFVNWFELGVREAFTHAFDQEQYAVCEGFLECDFIFYILVLVEERKNTLDTEKLDKRNKLIHSFVEKTLMSLYARVERFEKEHPGKVFDITCVNEKNLLVCLIKYFIKLNSPDSYTVFVFLLEIPSVAVMYPGLLHLAYNHKNAIAIKVLEDVRAIHNPPPLGWSPLCCDESHEVSGFVSAVKRLDTAEEQDILYPSVKHIGRENRALLQELWDRMQVTLEEDLREAPLTNCKVEVAPAKEVQPPEDDTSFSIDWCIKGLIRNAFRAKKTPENDLLDFDPLQIESPPSYAVQSARFFHHKEDRPIEVGALLLQDDEEDGCSIFARTQVVGAPSS